MQMLGWYLKTSIMQVMLRRLTGQDRASGQAIAFDAGQRIRAPAQSLIRSVSDRNVPPPVRIFVSRWPQWEVSPCHSE
jgi:hypothetical protein